MEKIKKNTLKFLFYSISIFFPNVKECINKKQPKTYFLFCSANVYIWERLSVLSWLCVCVCESPREWGLGSSVLHSVQRVAADSGRFSTHVDFTSAPAEGWVGETAQRPTPNLLKVIKLEKGYGLMLNWGERPFFWAWARKGHLVKAVKWWRIYSFW